MLRRITVFLLLIPAGWAVTNGSAAAPPPPGETISRAVVDHGFENVAVRETDGLITIWFENRVYRYDMVALGVVARLASDVAEPLAVLELVPESRGVPLISVSAPSGDWARFLDGEEGAAGFRSRLQIEIGKRRNGEPLALRGQATRNQSYFRTDLDVRPLFSFELGFPGDPLRQATSLAPEATMAPFRGGLLTTQVAFRLHDDFELCAGGLCDEKVYPSRATLTVGGWLPDAWLASASAGIFPSDQYGVAGQTGKLILDGRLEVVVGADATGKLRFLEGLIEYSSVKYWATYASLTHRSTGIDLASTLTIGRFYDEELAVRVDLVRTWHELDFGLFAVSNDLDTQAGATLRIPLPVKRSMRPTRLRLATVPAFPIVYQDTFDRIGVSASLFDNLDRLRKRLYPTFIRNNVEDLRRANDYLEVTR